MRGPKLRAVKKLPHSKEAFGLTRERINYREGENPPLYLDLNLDRRSYGKRYHYESGYLYPDRLS